MFSLAASNRWHEVTLWMMMNKKDAACQEGVRGQPTAERSRTRQSKRLWLRFHLWGVDLLSTARISNSGGGGPNHEFGHHLCSTLVPSLPSLSAHAPSATVATLAQRGEDTESGGLFRI